MGRSGKIDLVFGAGIFVVAGEIFGLGELPPFNQAPPGLF
jgi:hypothetical protein